MRAFFGAILFAVAATVSAAPASAATTVVSGTTTGGDTFQRPVAELLPTALSGIGNNVEYEAIPFMVSLDGLYDFFLAGTAPTGWDTYLLLYQGSFDPANSLNNAIAGNDDYNETIGYSGIDAMALTAGTQYYAVVTAYSNGGSGQYTMSITGPGSASFGAGSVPEPSTWVMLILGAGMIGGVLRTQRRKAQGGAFAIA